MGCLGMVLAVLLASAGLEKLDTNFTMGLILVSLSVIVGVIAWWMDRKDDESRR